MFDAAAGDYVATYGDPPPPPQPPETTITAFTVSGSTAQAEFTSDAPGATYECRLDGGAFAACATPRQYAGLAPGQHTFQVRAVDPASTADPTPAERIFTVVDPSQGTGKPKTGPESGPPGGTAGQTPGSDRRAPRILVRTRVARVSSRGDVSLRATCPQGEASCRVGLRLQLRRGYVATRTLTLTGGQTRSFRLRLRRAARIELAIDRSLRVTAVAAARDAAGNKATVRTAVRLLAPRRR